MGKSWDDLTTSESSGDADWSQFGELEGKPKTGRTAGELLKDVGADILGATLGVAKVGALVGDAVSHQQGFDNPAVRFLHEFGDSVAAQKSSILREKEQANEQAIEAAGRSAKESFGDGALGTAARVAAEFGTGAKGILTDPALLAGFAAQQVPMLGTMGAGSSIANKTVGAAAKALPKLAATKAGQVAVGGAGTAGAVGAGMALQGTEVADSAYNELMKLPDAAWRNHPQFESLSAKIGAEQAKVAIANREAAEAGGKGALATLLTTLMPGGASVEKLIAGKGIGSLKAIPGAVFGEARQEGLEEGFGKLYGNQAVGAVDPTKDVWQGVGGNAGQGAVGGGMLGGAMTGGRLALDSVDEPAKRMAEALAQRGNAGAANSPVTADEVLGHSPFANSEQPAAVPVPPKQSEAEKALLTPKQLTALDRVTEIDAKLPTATPEELPALRAERDSITATWPKAVLGAAASFSTETGARLNAQYALVEADELTTSHDENLKPTPTYPPELQPRERDRTASEMQIQGIVGKLDPARLGESADAATGAPIVGADGLVESGNARTIALKRVYQANGQKAADYRQYLKDNAGRFGIAPEAVDGVRNPVLVRVRTTPVNRAEFARQANASTVAQMSPGEQAKADAARIDVLDDLSPDDSGDFTSSRNFIRRFVARLPGTEQSGMIDANGELSQSGYARVRNAVLAKAYGDSPVLMRMVESLDDDQRNVSKALMKVAPTVAKMRQSIGDGALFDVDLTPDLLAAVEALATLRGKGRTVATELAQSDVFGSKYSDETREILAFLADNIRRPNQIAGLIQQFAEVLEAAGNPNQGSLLGEATAPAKRDILAAARRELNDNDAAGKNGETGQGHRDAGAEARRQPEAAPGAAASDSRNEAARGRESAGQSEWVAFPPDSGTLGIPRAEMPQVKGEHRGALIQFLDGKGITYSRVSVPASEIKPTQAEFSTKKAGKWAEVREGVDRSVLTSSDGYILDGHHQYVAALAAGEPVTAIRFDAPIRELMAEVFQFPSVQRSEGSNVVELRAQARKDFKDALADLAQIMTKHTRAAMMPEDTPNLMPTLVKLFEAGIKEVGYSLKDLVGYVKKALKADPRFKTTWNKISDTTYRKAAQQAIDGEATQRVDDLFAQAEERKGQQDMFAQAPAVQVKSAPKVAMINGRPYDMRRDNFKPPLPPEFLTPELLKRADEFIAKYYKGKPKFAMSPEDRAAGEKLLAPALEKAGEAKAEYDQKIIDIAKRTGSVGQMLAPLKGIERAVEKMKQDQDEKGAASMDPADVKDLLRSTIVVNTYADAQPVLDEIEREFKVLRVKNRTETGVTQAKANGREGTGGYSDILVNVIMPNGTTAEIQINVSEMLAIKEYQGHKLFEAVRDLPKGDRLKAEIYGAMTEIYDAAFAAASVTRPAEANSRQLLAQFRNTASEIGAQPLAGNLTRGSSESPESSSLNTLPSGNSTNSSPPNEAQNRLPSGNLSGTGIISTTSNNSIANPKGDSYTNGINSSIGDANAQHGNAGAEGDAGPVAGPAQGSGGERATAGLPEGSRGRDRRGNNDADDGNRHAPDGVQSREDTDGAGRGAEDGRKSGNRKSPRRDAGIPAGRDIPAKSGRNYRFGDDDLTYAGSWLAKARQNVEAVELLKTLQAENRQATREEQAVLAKFIGWGASEIANSMFGEKLEKQLKALANYDEAIENLGDRPYLTNARYHEYRAAFELLQSKTPALSWYTAGNITKAMLDAAKPDASVRKWGDLRARIEKVMTPDEFREASKSTQYAHYTSKAVVSSILAAVDQMGFKGGTILEPGAGIGVFPGLLGTETATNSVYTGIEMDPVTGGILKQLFPDERILVESFIDSKLPENFYDVAIGNPPFSGQVTVLADPKYAKNAFKLHDYFFAKSLDSVKPGGLVVFVTSRYTMDKKGDKARAFMAERADLVGAIRLPQTAFQKNAGTDVVTDVLFLRKKVPGETFAGAQPWMGLGEVSTPEGKFLVNEYFTTHPEMVLGEHSGKGKMQNSPGPQYTLLARGGDIESQFSAAAASLPSDVFVAGRGSAAEAAKVREMDFNPKAEKEGAFYISDAGVLMRREGGVGVRAEEKHQKDAELLKDYVGLRDTLKQAQYDQLNDGDWEASMKALQQAYAGFVKKNGNILQNTAYMQKVKVEELDDEGVPTGNKVDDEEERRRFPLLQKIRTDPEWVLVSALENVNEDTGTVTESEWLTKRTLGGEKKAEIRTPTDALLATLDDTGEIDIPLIAARVGLSDDETIEALGTLIYDDPAGGWTMADEYLSGNVKAKLAAAEEAAKSDKRYQRNVDALKDVQPAPKGAGDIKPQIGMNWIPGEIYAQFLEAISGVSATIEYVERTREWTLVADGGTKSPRATVDWGVDERANAAWIMEKALTGAAISLNKSEPDGKGGSKTVFDPDRTEAANAKRTAMRQEFQSWVFQDADRTSKLVKIYNDKFNTTVQRKFDGRHLSLPGTSRLFNIFDHVKRGAWRVIQTGNTYLAHAVGSGKTFEMVISAMEQKRLGKIKKPMIIVPGHMLQQFATEWQQLYPTARLAVADEKDFHTDNRRKFVARVAMSDLDGVIMTHSSFKLLDLDPEFKQGMIEQELEFLRASYEEAGGDLDDIGNKKMRKEPKIKRIEAQIEKLEQQLAKSMSSEGKDKSVRFDEMGVDFLYVDEAHLFRKLSYATNRQMKGIDPNGSEMAFDLYMKTRWLAKKNPKRYLVMASGTPITNTTAELYTVQRFMAPEALEEKGLQSFDDWASQFGEEATAIEATSSGKYEPVTRFSKFINVGEMTQMFRDFADVLNEDHLAALLGDKRPKVAGGARKSIITPKTEAYADFQRDELIPRINASKAFKPTFEEPNNPDPIININTDARLAAIDMRFMDPSLPSDPDSKLNQMIDGVIRIYQETANNEYRAKSKEKDSEGNDIPGPVEPIKGATQMVFFESGFGRQVAINRGFNARAWMEKRLRDAGIPPSQLAFMEDYKKSTAKLKLFKEVNTGKVRILVGSSAAMGTGVNAQQRLIALHHLDAPMVPAVLEQREGRIIRQGNKNPQVQIYAYSMKGSFDENQWGMLARKKFFIEQALSGDPNIREIDDVGDVSQLELAAGMVAENPYVMQHAGAKAEAERLMRLSRAHEESRARMQDDYSNAGRTIEMNEKRLPDAEKEASKVKNLSGDAFIAKADGKSFDNRKDWGVAILSRYKALADKLNDGSVKVGEISGFDVTFAGAMVGGAYRAQIRLADQDTVLAADALTDPVGMAMRAVNALVAIERKPSDMRRIISEAKAKRDALATRLDAPFPLAEQLANKVKEVAELEKQMIEYGNNETSLEREQGIEDDWQAGSGAAMFSIAPDGNYAVPAVVMDSVAAQKVIDRFRAKFPGANKMVAVPDFAALPANVQEDARNQGGNEKNTKGAFDHRTGTVYIVAGNHTSEADVQETVFHEALGHLGTRTLLGKEFVSELNSLFDAFGGLEGLAKIAKDRGFSKEFAAYVKGVAQARQKNPRAFTTLITKAVLAEEVFAHSAQHNPKLLDRLKALVGKLREFLRKHGLAKLAEYGETDLLWMLQKAKVKLRTGQADGRGGWTVFMTAWHGSPHDHNKFDSSKIGTGEGAQAYGWGHYFAGSREVAEWYRDKLAFNDNEIQDEAEYFIERADGSEKQAIRDLRSAAANEKDTNVKRRYLDAAGWIESGKVKANPGRLYQVDLKPAEDEYLLWDKPLSEQSAKVKAALEKDGVLTSKGAAIQRFADRNGLSVNEAEEFVGSMIDLDADKTGHRFYRSLFRHEVHPDKAASEYLLSLGIRGIKYLDGSSRSAGEGNYNYVIFDDADIEITAHLSRLNQVREDTGRRIHIEDLTAVAQAFRAAFPGLPVHALESERQAPKELLKWIGEQNARGEWSGAIHRGEVYLLRTGLMDTAHAMETAIHEAEHAGLERMFGQQLDGAMLAIYQTNPSVRAKADALMQRYRYSAVRATNEVLADMGPKAKRVIAWSKLVAKVRDILRGIKIGGKPWVKQWSDNDINALVLRALAAAKRPAGGVAQGTWTALSRSAMKSLSANMQRGFDSLAKAITERTSVHRAMFRNGLGWVDFVWGDHGAVKASGRTKGARGLSHIVEARMRKDGLSEAQAIAVLREMVRTIAAGEEFDRKAFADVVRVGIRHDGFIVWLAKRPGSNAWVVTGYEENPDGKAAGRATASPTSAVASLTRDDDGAGSAQSLGVIDAGGNTRLSRSGQPEIEPTIQQQADAIISTKAATAAPLDALVRVSMQKLGIDRLTMAAYHKAGALLDRLVPETVKAGIISDYGVPEAVIDRRVVSEARQKQQTRAAGALIDKLSTLTRAESRVAYAWMNNDDPQAAAYFEQQLPPESLKVLEEVKQLIDDLSKEAVRLGQLSPESFERNRFAYLHRSYVKHTAELTKGEAKGRARAISILGDQYKGRGMVDGVPMSKVMNIAPEWWKRKLQNGKADAMLKGEKFVRLERRAAIEGDAVLPLEDRQGPAMGSPKAKPRLLETIYWPAGETIPARYAGWEQAGTWEVRDTKGDKLVVWRDFTAQERQQLGEIDEARYAIAKTLHNMIHDVETGHYLEWLAQNYAKKDGEEIDGAVVEAREWGGLNPGVLKPGEWVLVPDTKITGTKVLKYGALAGRYLPGPIWNDVRQMTGRFQPLGETYAAILRAWKMSKTSLSPGVHMNNVMSNFVMADWHDVTAGHVLKALKLMASKDAAAAEVLARFGESGGTIGTWAVKELQQEQLRPLLEALEAELGMAGEVAGQVGVMSALQLAMRRKLGQAFDAARLSKTGQMAGKGVQAMLDTYEAEDQVFRLAAWLKAKEEGASDVAAGKVARKSFLDYRINAPWIQMMRSTAFPFIAFPYRAVPMMLETAATKPWKLMKLGLVAGALNTLGYLLSGGDADDERKLLPEEKAGRIWGITPKLIRMPWNDEHDSPVFLDVRRWVPVGDVFDVGATHAAVPILPSMQPGGPLMIMAELALNKQGFTGKPITLDTDTATEQATKLADYLWKAAAPNIPVLPGTYSWTAISNSATGKTDAFGREQSLPQAVVSSMGIKLGSYPKDVLRMNARRAAQAEIMEIDRNITGLKREYQKHGVSVEEFREKVAAQTEKKRKLVEDLQKKMSGGR